MIYTGGIPCFYNGLAKNNKIMSMFVLFSWLFATLKLVFFRKWGTNLRGEWGEK